MDNMDRLVNLVHYIAIFTMLVLIYAKVS